MSTLRGLRPHGWVFVCLGPAGSDPGRQHRRLGVHCRRIRSQGLGLERVRNVSVGRRVGPAVDGQQHRAGVPAEVLGLAWGGYGSRAISILIMISALGAINGMIFPTARIYSEFGNDHRLFQPLSKWSRRWGTPVRALMTQAALTLALL